MLIYVNPTTIIIFPHTPPTEIYTLSLHDALPIYEAVPRLPRQADADRRQRRPRHDQLDQRHYADDGRAQRRRARVDRSEEHTSELQSLRHLVCRLLLEKKK